MTELSPELLPCPFCGSRNVHSEQTVTDGSVWCGDCCGKMVKADEPTAIEQWNTRATLVDENAMLRREAHWKRWPNGDAGDAIDFACGHIEDATDAMDFLDNWRANFMLHRYPEYLRWLAVQRECARTALSHKETNR